MQPPGPGQLLPGVHRLFLSVTFLSTTALALRLRPQADISYGVYLWGFPVQQIMTSHFSEHGVVTNQLLSLATSLLLGWASCDLVEKHGIKLGNAISRNPGQFGSQNSTRPSVQ